VHMALTVAASRARGESSLTYPHAYRISYPEFLDDMRAIGLDLGVEDDHEAAREPGGVGRRAVESVAIDQAAEVPIVDWVGRWVRERPDEIAIVDVREARTKTWTWAQLDAKADRLAALLLELGVESGETVAYQLPNWAEFAAFTLAAAKIGAVGCALMPIFREREVSHALRRTGARVLVIADRFRGRDHLAETEGMLGGATNGAATLVEHVLVVGADGAPELPVSGAVHWHDLHAAAAAQQPDPEAIAARKPATDAPAHVFFTSGTSGEPKGVVHRFDALTRAAFMEVEHLGLGRDDRMFIPTPLAHQTGFLYGMWLAFVLGSGQILQDVWEPWRGARALREWEGTFVQAATPFLADLLGAIEDGAPVPPALRIFVVTGAAVPRALAARATEVLSAAVCGAWGATESCLAALAAPGEDPEVVWGTDGRALAGTRIRINGDDGDTLPPGTEGNLEVRSRCLFDRYLDRPDLTAAAFTPDGWYRTGDLATIDADGYLRITGRVKDVINRGGEKVPVAELEQLLHEHPLIEEVAIAAMPDERLGERACAFVVRNGGEGELDLEEVRRYLDRRKVARQYWPERVEEVEEMPRTPSGKIQKFVLRERAKGLRAEGPSSTEKEQIS
jgi:cyclohexanecarboxylate-CoA ligase